MANRSYPPFGKVKTIVLPIPSSPLTYQQYKETYGIDLKEFFNLDDTYITLKELPNTLLLFDVTSIRKVGYVHIPNLVPVGALPFNYEGYSEGSNDALARYYFYTYDASSSQFVPLIYAYFCIAKDSEMLIENLEIGESEF